VPAPQLVHEAAPYAAWYVPAAHASQRLLADAPAYRPESHSPHEPPPLAPWYAPAGQAAQLSAASPSL
jgi:hypothetical protein